MSNDREPSVWTPWIQAAKEVAVQLIGFLIVFIAMSAAVIYG